MKVHYPAMACPPPRRLTALDIYRSAIPMRSFEHAAARRDLAEAIIVRAGFSDGSEGWGETLPRPYVTGETLDSVIEDIQRTLWPAAVSPDTVSPDTVRPDTGYDLPLPLSCKDGRRITAAACAIDLAMSGTWRKMGTPCNFPIGRPNETCPGSEKIVRCPHFSPALPRVSGVLGSSDPRKTLRKLRLMRLFGLRDFKLKLGLGQEIDDANLRGVHRVLARSIAAGRCTLRVDVNGGWDTDSTPERLADLVKFGVCVVEQPVYCSAAELVALARRCKKSPLPLMADESLVTLQDAQTLLEEPSIWWNIRLSKNGGFSPCLRLAAMAGDAGVNTVVGCMVGESGILSAAQRQLLQQMPFSQRPPRFVEGNYGRFLLKDDIVRPAMRFGYGGRLKAIGREAAVAIDLRKLQRYAKLVQTLRS